MFFSSQEEAGKDSGSDSDSDSDGEGGTTRKKSGSKSRESSEQPDKAKFKKAATGDDSDSDDSYWDSDSDESSESSSDDEPGMSLREKFLKKATDEGKKKKEKKPKAERGDKAKKKKLRVSLSNVLSFLNILLKLSSLSFWSQAIDEDEDEDEDDEGAGKGEKWETVDRGGLEKPKMFDKDAEINHENVLKKLQEIMAARGKKRTNRKEQISLLNELHDISQVNSD